MFEKSNKPNYPPNEELEDLTTSNLAGERTDRARKSGAGRRVGSDDHISLPSPAWAPIEIENFARYSAILSLLRIR